MRKDTVAPILLKDRNIIEGNFVISLWKNPDLFLEYDINTSTDFKTEAGKLYYIIGNGMIKRGINTFDEISVETFLMNFPEYKNKFEEYGGYSQFKSDSEVIDESNIDFYYDELQKSNLLITLYKMGFNVDEDYNLFSKTSSQGVYDYYIDLIETASIRQSDSSIEIHDLCVTDKFVEECDSGKEMGYNYAKKCPILNGITMGLMSKEVVFFCGQSGTFKTSFSFSNFIMPLVDNGNKACIISNEQGVNEFLRILSTMVLTDKFDYYGLVRKKLIAGGLSEEQKMMMKKVVEYTNDKYKGNLFLATIGDYDIKNVEKIIRKKSREGVKIFLYDTFKAENMSDKQFWGKLMEDSQTLLQIARKEDVNIILTYQLATDKQRERYLDATCLGASKGVKNICSQMVLSRPIFPDEYTDERNDIRPFTYNYEILDEKGKPTKDYIQIYPQNGKDYIILFVEKTRTDSGRQQILYEVQGNWNKWKEIGFCNIKYN